ncbi:response regulator transcription factor [Mucilaginibacter terrae]|uniref:DNA-binding NarL/FixJ family response regulator n=1 Tax=Mucilaginibacter terrae TaxID=1955052 RepID=A0ABU3H0L6_9SPHI|nr:response regulator transcription factor [Mucilaginibacter terrae]MDT3405553.1 DNA-binding NarL/FixJ family response regulator [Mucilaginibacter terrae]
MNAIIQKPDFRKVNILLAEDHHIVRNGIRSLLEKQSFIHIVGEAENGAEALQLINDGLRPDILITDINMPGMGGVELIENLKVAWPKTRVVVLSMLDNDKFITRAFNAGASAYLLKNVSPEELMFAIKLVQAGQEYICAELGMKLVKRLGTAPELLQPDEELDLDLSERDIEVLQLIAEGYTNQQIGDKLFTGKRTVEGYRQNLMNKTGSRNTAALIRFALLHGIIR